jgi:predicted nucleic-acid-binding protein
VNAVDTNILVRWLTRDDPYQAALADQVLSQPVFVPLTVLIEVAWVLAGKAYRFDRQKLNDAFRTLMDLKMVRSASEEGVRWALDRHLAGAHLADMIHIVASRGADAFLTFEKRLGERAGVDTPLPIHRIA